MGGVATHYISDSSRLKQPSLYDLAVAQLSSPAPFPSLDDNRKALKRIEGDGRSLLHPVASKVPHPIYRM
jgi:hypothetical protein